MTVEQMRADISKLYPSDRWKNMILHDFQNYSDRRIKAMYLTYSERGEFAPDKEKKRRYNKYRDGVQLRMDV